MTINTTTATTRTATCPSWCVQDVAPEDIVDGVQQGGDTVLHMAADVSGKPWRASGTSGSDGTEPAHSTDTSTDRCHPVRPGVRRGRRQGPATSSREHP